MADELVVECLNRANWLRVYMSEASSLLPTSRTTVSSSSDIPRCPHCLVVCDGCETEMKAAELGSHDRVCSTETIRCPSCNSEHLRSQSASHADVCPAAIVPCEHAAHGCSWTGPRSELQSTHTPHCPYAALQGFFRISDARAAALETENVLLRARLDAAEGMLAVMRHELQAIKGALGPWSPDADCSPPSPYAQAALSPAAAAAHHHPFSPPASATVPLYQWRGHNDPPADVMAHLPPPPAPTTTALSEDPTTAGIAPADLAAYFPPPASDASPNSPPSPTATTTATTNGTTGRSLSATLTELRSAVQTHDARARMSASAHAAELGAIRQVVAGLRMQLHAVLMELSNASSNGHGADGWTPPKLPAAARFFLPGLVPPPPPPAVSITKL
ncbi:hypothetical protein EDB89DRAFT_2072272 [Lactarius sanguifluus]|nr:hypothetical protein EDB89DRAFT_2072272 [Lactarius sanguifluus]